MRKRGEGGLTQIGKISAELGEGRNLIRATRAELQLGFAAARVRENPNDTERAFMVRQLVLCTLPHTDPGDVDAWSRRSGSIALGIQPGVDFDTGQKIGYPYGTIPRLLMFWTTTEVQRTKNRADMTTLEKRTLQLGSSLDAFMRQIGLNPDNGSGKRSDARRLHNQMDRLFSSRIGWVEKHQIGTAEGKERGTMQVSPRFALWWDPKQPRQGSLLQSWVLLSEEFYDALVNNPVPVDMRALRALKRSPLALDLYAWACYQSFVIVQKRLPAQFVAWEQLRQQFGADYKDPKNFKKKAQGAVRKIAALYPGLKIGKAKGGFTIHATRLAVPQKPVQKSLDNRSFPG